MGFFILGLPLVCLHCPKNHTIHFFLPFPFHNFRLLIFAYNFFLMTFSFLCPLCSLSSGEMHQTMSLLNLASFFNSSPPAPPTPRPPPSCSSSSSFPLPKSHFFLFLSFNPVKFPHPVFFFLSSQPTDPFALFLPPSVHRSLLALLP